MTKLIPILATLAAVATTLQQPTMATAAQVKLGWCYPTPDCTGSDAVQVNGVDTRRETSLMSYPCASFLGAPDPPANVYACEGGCNADCDLAVPGQCQKITPGKPKGTRFGCAFRTKHFE